jgi:hypothetical protein
MFLDDVPIVLPKDSGWTELFFENTKRSAKK